MNKELFKEIALYKPINWVLIEARQLKWDLHWLNLAKFTAQSSKDPSTKTGAVIVSPKNTVVSTGYNGFAVGVEDSVERYNNRPLKYLMVCHCEMNAILFAKKDLENHTLYTYPFCSCSNCAKYVIQSGIKRCVAPVLPSGGLTDRWKEDTELAQLMFKEASVELILLDYK